MLAEWPNLGDGALFETYACGEIVRWLSWQPDPADFHSTAFTAVEKWISFFTRHRVFLAIETKAGERAYAADARPLGDLLSGKVPGVATDAERVGVVLTRGVRFNNSPTMRGRSLTGNCLVRTLHTDDLAAHVIRDDHAYLVYTCSASSAESRRPRNFPVPTAPGPGS